MQSVLTSWAAVWCQRNDLHRVVKAARHIMGAELPTLDTVDAARLQKASVRTEHTRSLPTGPAASGSRIRTLTPPTEPAAPLFSTVTASSYMFILCLFLTVYVCIILTID